MRRYLPGLFLLLVLLPSIVGAQTQVLPASTARFSDGRWWTGPVELRLEGNACWPTPDGYLTVLSLDGAGIASTLRTYDRQGRELHRIDFPQIINLQVDPAGTKAVFHDGERLHVFDLHSFHDRAYTGATLAFAIGPNSQVAFYDREAQAVRAGVERYPMADAPHQLTYFGGRLMALNHTALYELSNGQSNKRHFCAGSRTALWLREVEGLLELTEKRRTPEQTILYTWRSADGHHFQLVGTQERTGAYVATPPTQYAAASYAGHPTPTREPIRGPLNYAANNVLGPVGNSYNEMQEYGGQPYPHPGIDLLGVAGQEVRAVRRGVVRAILTTAAAAHWRVAVSYGRPGADSLGYLYAHVDQNSVLFAPGDSVRAGELLALLVSFPVTGFDHCHFARITDNTRQWTGAWWTVDDPLVDLVNHRDSTPPVLNPAGPGGELLAFRRQGSNQYLDPNNLSGRFDIISKPSDRCNSTWEIDIYDERYALRRVNTPQSALLDTLGFRFDARNDNYRGTTSSNYYSQRMLKTTYSRDITCFSTGNYQQRQFYHILTNGDGDNRFRPNDSLRTFNSAAYANGLYWLSVTVHDAAGNVARDSMQIRLNNATVGLAEETAGAQLLVWPNPTSGLLHINGSLVSNDEVVLIDALGRRTMLKPQATGPETLRLDLRAFPAGSYTLETGPLTARRRTRIVHL